MDAVSFRTKAVYPVVVPVKYGLQSVNFYLYKTEQSLVLIDAGFDIDDCWEALLHTLSTHGYTLSDITAILVTHHHVDHVGLINRITIKHDIPVYAHPYAIPRMKRDPVFMEERIQFFQSLYEKAGTGEAGRKQIAHLKEALVKNKDSSIKTEIIPLDLEKPIHRLNLHYFPGHASDQIAFHDKETDWLFSGDLLIGHMASNSLIEYRLPNEPLQSPLLQHIDSYQKLLKMDVKHIYPGHGKKITNHKALIHHRLEAIEEKGEKIFQLIQKGYKTPNDIARKFYEKRFDTQFALVMSSILGQLYYLETKGKIGKALYRGVWYYEVIT